MLDGIQALEIYSHEICYIFRYSLASSVGAGVYLYSGRTGDILCPVTAVLGYLAIHPTSIGPLCLFEDGTCYLDPAWSLTCGQHAILATVPGAH